MPEANEAPNANENDKLVEDKKNDEKKDDKPEDDKADPMGDVAGNLQFWNAADDAEEFRSLNSEEGKPVFSQCCCCICLCHTKKTDGISCMCCVPIKAGIMAIGVLTLILAAVQISCQFFLMLNDQVAWWFPLVNIFLLVPTYVAASFFVVWFGKDCVSTRGRLFCSCIMVIVSASLIAVWNVIYFVWIYKKDTVYYGWGTTEEGYTKFQKKYYIFRELLFAVIVLTLWSYFLCVCVRYADLLKTERSAEDRVEYLDDKAFREQANIHLDDSKKEFKKAEFLKEHKAAMDKKLKAGKK